MSLPMVPLGGIADFYAGVSLPEGDPWSGQEEGFLLVRVSDMNLPGNGRVINSAREWSGCPGQRSATCPAGSLVIPKRGGAIGTNKKRIIERPAVLDPNLMGINPREGDLDLGYLHQWFQTFNLESIASGSSVPQLNKKDLSPLEIPLPPLAEQKRIAAVLDQVDALRAKRREAIALLDDLVHAVFLKMFGDPAGNPKGWPVVPLGVVISEGPSNGLYKPSGEYGSGVPILRIDSFQSGVLSDPAGWRRVKADSSEIARYGILPGDVVINRVNSRSHLGKAVLVADLPEPAVYESNMMRFRVDSSSIVPFYLVHFMASGFVKKQVLESAKDAVNQSSINQGDVRRLRINLPPVADQEEFVRKAKEIEVLKDSHRAHLATLDELFTSLQQRAFSGRLWGHEAA